MMNSLRFMLFPLEHRRHRGDPDDGGNKHGNDAVATRIADLEPDMSPGGRVEKIVVTAEEAGQRLDRVLAARVGELSRSRLKALIVDGCVSVAGEAVGDPALHVKAGAEIVVAVPPPEPAEPEGETIPL